MCQLLCAHMGDSQLNKIAISSLIMAGASSGNRHGTGIFTINQKPVSWKTSLDGSGIINLGKVVNSVVGKSVHPIFAHVRDASKGIEVNEENAHPFTGKRFILAHNGRLWADAEWESSADLWSASSESGVSSDSKRFLDALESEAELAPSDSVLNLLNRAMKGFSGKFAFLILDTLDGVFYVARGTTATLNFSSVYSEMAYEPDENGKEQMVQKNPIGFIVATRKDTLEGVGNIIGPLLQVTSGGKYITVGAPVELTKDTLYKIDGKELVLVGEFKENVVAWSATSSYTAHARGSTRGSTDDTSIEIWALSSRIQRFMEEHFLAPEDIDAILLLTLGKPLSTIQEGDLRLFIEKFIPILSAGKKTRAKIRDILPKSGRIHSLTYTKVPDLEYPWMVNTKEKIAEMIDYLRKEKKSK